MSIGPTSASTPKRTWTAGPALWQRSAPLLATLATAALLLLLGGCQDGSDQSPTGDIGPAREACQAAANFEGSACSRQCSRLQDAQQESVCEQACDVRESAAVVLCQSPLGAFETACIPGACAAQANACSAGTTTDHQLCTARCGEGDILCLTRCDEQAATSAQHCGFLPANVSPGSIALPPLDAGAPAHLPTLLDEAEMAVVEAADARAAQIRQRSVELWTGQPGAQVNVTQVEHHFPFGIPLDIREFENAEDELAFYADIGRNHATLLVAETSLKWRNVEREKGLFTFDNADAELAWAEALGFDVKAHVLLWGNDPPLASGSGTPDWLREQFPNEDLTDAEKASLRALIRAHIERVVSQYRGRIDVWEVTNEMLNPITDWFAIRLGQDIVEDLFRWSQAADPGAELVYNEWINEIFTGLGGPDAAAVRDRVLALREAGTPVHALGQQGHFAPGLVNVGVDVDLGQRTRVDTYADALDTLAEAGLPIHITEVTFAAPDEPELRAAQAEAIMRVWWGHPAVEEIIFWNFWNPLGPRSQLNLGVYGDDNNLTRHGEAILSLLNDRWRTRVDALADDDGRVALRATHGLYLAQWDTPEGPVHVRFHVAPGPDQLRVVAVNGEPAPEE
mgnify:CR=1 FL=1